jgi:hypothetical protein
MSETVQLALVAALPIIATQMVTAYLAYKGRVKQDEKLNSIHEQGTVIHQQTNSNLTEQRVLIKTLQDQINSLILEKGKAEGEKDKRQG